MIESHVVEDVYLIIFIICGSFAVFYYHREEITMLISRWWRVSGEAAWEPNLT